MLNFFRPVTCILNALPALILLLFLHPVSVQSQTNWLGNQNLVTTRKFDWKRLSTEHIDLHFYAESPMLAADAAKLAEEALYDVSHKLDYAYKHRYSIFLFLAPQDLIQSSQWPDYKMKEGGTTPLFTNSANVIYPGSQAGLKSALREAIAGMLLNEFSFGGSIQASIQNTALLNLPKWYSEGLTAYLGEGWTYRDEMEMAGLENTDLLPLALEGNSPIHRTVRKSIWYFIAQQYGENKIAEIFYMTRFARSVESGMLNVLSVKMVTLTERWRDFIRVRNEDNKSGREAIEKTGSRISIPPNQRLLSFAFDPKGKYAAAWLEKGGKYRLTLIDARSGALRETDARGGFRTDQLTGFRPEPPVSFHPSGNKIATAITRDNGEVLLLVDALNGTVKKTPLGAQALRVLDLAWNHEGTEIAVSALQNGNVDLFLIKPGEQKLRKITNDNYDDLSPVWSMDDQSILFSSNRGPDTIAPARANFTASQWDFDVYQVALNESGYPLRRVSITPGVHEYPEGMASSFEVIVRTDESGIINLKKINLFIPESSFLTNVTRGLDAVSLTDSMVAWSFADKGRHMLYISPRASALSEVESGVTSLRFQRNLEEEALRKKLDKAKVKAVIIPPPVQEDTLSGQPDQTQPADSGKKVKFYVFDEEDTQKKTRRQKSVVRVGGPEEEQRPDFAAMKLEGPSRTKSVWATDFITTQLQWDPVFRLAMQFEARITDLTGNHRIISGYRPYIDLRSADFYLNYQYLRGRTDFYAGFTRSGRYLNREGFFMRYNSTAVKAGAVYPLNRFMSVGGELSATHLQRIDLNPFMGDSLDGKALPLEARLNYTLKKVDMVENYIKKGSFLSVDVRNVFFPKKDPFQFTSIQLDARRYTPVFKNFVLASRIAGGFSIGPNRRNFFLGGIDGWLFGKLDNPEDLPANQNISDFHYSGFVTPVHGFSWNARNGTQYVMVNNEFRIPLSRMLTTSLNSSPVYSLELLAFFDIGTVWRQGNPLSQENPIDSEDIPGYPVSITVQTLKSPFIMGFGPGIRLNAVGYSMRFDLGWGIEDETLIKPRFTLSLGKNF